MPADPIKRVVVKHTLHLLRELNVTPLCEGVETLEELDVLRDLGVSLVQGYLLAKPSFESLAVPMARDYRSSTSHP
jgi:EAL domain-containing protein (putative c-di-GMP-specific phosphodiesterase class I)